MRKLAALALGLLSFVTAAHAVSLSEAQALLEAGELEQALEAYRALQVAEPENPEVLFGLASSFYALAEAAREENQPQDAAKQYGEALEYFKRAAEAEDAAWLGPQARYNRANVLTRLAQAQIEQPEQAVAAFRQAEQAYEQILEANPQVERARQNVDYVRYQIRQLMQLPQDQQQDQEDQQDQEQSKAVFFSATTQLPDMKAEAAESVVRLQRESE